MRATVFFLNLCLILLCGGHNGYAKTHDSYIYHTPAYNLAENKQLQFSAKEQNTTIIEDIDFDLEEDYVSNHNINESNKCKIFTAKGDLSNGCYATFGNLFALNYYSFKNCNTSPSFRGDSSPIYIKNRVLRI